MLRNDCWRNVLGFSDWFENRFYVSCILEVHSGIGYAEAYVIKAYLPDVLWLSKCKILFMLENSKI